MRLLHGVWFTMLLMVVAGERTWKVIQRDFSYETLATSVSFVGPQSGWMVARDERGPFLLHTEDGGTTLNMTTVPGDFFGIADLWSISMFDHKHGVAGWQTLGNLCGLYTNDGETWTDVYYGLGIGCNVVDTKSPTLGVYILIGNFPHHLGQVDGIFISTDGGKTWSLEDWKQGLPARYGWFKDAKVGIVTGGKMPGPVHGGYEGLIASTVDGGKSWKTMQNWTDRGVCFHQVSCIDERTCWTVGEGLNEESRYVAYIYSTTDGFATMNQQLYFVNGYLKAIHMVNATFGWAVGHDFMDGRYMFTGHFFQWDGKTWTNVQQIPNFEPNDLSVIDSDIAYAVGMNEHYGIDLARYYPLD